MSQLTNPNRKIMQRIAWFFITLMINQIAFPAAALALTSGPSQPEVQSFQPVGTTEMVNLFSGDFSYNVPLFEVPGPDGGYPVNLFYNSVTDANKEASWTGLGWNINVGSLSRSMRGLPDDFDGEQVTRKLDMLKNETIVAGGNVGLEIGGYDGAKDILKNIGASLSLGVSYTYNSYRGAGFSIDPTIGLKGSFGGDNGTYKPRLSLGLNLSSTSMASLNTSFSMSKTTGDVTRGFNFGLSFNGREGLSGMNLGYTESRNDEKCLDEEVIRNDKVVSHTGNPAGGGVSASYSFARTAYTPEVKIPWTGWNLAGSFSFAPGAAVVYGTFGFNGSYSVQNVQNGGIPQSSKAFGYNYLQNGLDDNRSLMDFNREKDGAVHRHNRFLATPSLSYDIYSVVGQGIGGMYRAHRSDYGFVYDPELFANTGGGSVGAQVGSYLKVGIDVSFNYSEQSNYRWPKYNGYFGNKNESYGFKTAQEGADFENVYYKTAGEMAAESLDAYDYMGGDKPLRLKKNADFQYDGTDGGSLESQEVKIDNAGNLTHNYEPTIKFNSGESKRANRRARNMAIQNISNNDLLDDNGDEVLPEYDVKYYDGTTGGAITQTQYANQPRNDLNRTANEQNAGFTALGIDGVRWVYGLPLQNHVQKEAIFSVDTVDKNACSKRVYLPALGNGEIDYKRQGTHKYIDEKTIPEYAHSYMLTSVLGSDYVDIDNVPGPSDGDVGYWMKTNYVKLSDNYQWRAPFFGANLIQGFENKAVDDMGSFMWGSREVYLPATIETKTHIAYFEISPRKDARGAGAYVQNENDPLGAYSYKLDKIKLYSKKEVAAKGIASAIPIKIVNFSYDYSLCPNVENNEDATENGKLTLKKVWFTYENSTRGSLSPYVFKYENSNRGYDEKAVDRWGVYKGYAQECDNLRNPYTKQFDHDDPNFKSNLDSDVASWHLSKIITPSGAEMNIELERDDYAYVQDAVATQMQPLTGLGVDENNNNYPDHGNVDGKVFINKYGTTGGKEQRVYFKLEEPLLPTEQDKLKKYIEDLPVSKRSDGGDRLYKQVYFKIRSNLKTTSDETYEYVTGYAEIEKDGDGLDMIGFDPNSPTDVNGAYTEAYLTLKVSRKEVKGQRYHPMIMANWNFLQNNLPDRMFVINQNPDPENAVPSMAGFGAGLGAIFSGYYLFARNNSFGQEIDLSKSFIKLNTPDRIKYGGGARVKQITLEDNWAPEANLTNTLGVVYDYTTTDENGEVYSSGVMENETSIGYDACALKYADIHEEIQGGIVKDIHIYEYPINEGMYPGSGVGYSQVTVRSLASDYAYKAATDPVNHPLPSDLPAGFGTTGQTVNEFYTAKDFPVITDKTDLDDTETQPWLSMLMSFLIMTRRDEYTGTQGYSIELNNMHGQMKGTKTYAQDNTGKVIKEPLTGMSYEYKTKTKYVKDRGRFKTVKVVDNEVDVLIDDDPNDVSAGNLDAKVEPCLVGVDYDFVMDGRESTSISASTGVAVNIDVTLIYPVPFPWPQFNLNGNRTRLAVTNKIINRRGIMTKTHSFDGQSHITTTNQVFDKYTGQPLLTYTDNQLGGGIYNYKTPAYLAHSTLGMAANNVGMKFEGDLQTASPTEYRLQGVSNAISNDLIAGDEYILSKDQSKTRAIYLGDDLFSLEGNLSSYTDITFHNIRSGNRNVLSSTIAQYSTIHHEGDDDSANPLKGRAAKTCNPDFITFGAGPVHNIVNAEFEAAVRAYNKAIIIFDNGGANVPVSGGFLGVAVADVHSSSSICGYPVFMEDMTYRYGSTLSSGAPFLRTNILASGGWYKSVVDHPNANFNPADILKIDILYGQIDLTGPIPAIMCRFYTSSGTFDLPVISAENSSCSAIGSQNTLSIIAENNATTVKHKEIDQVLSASASAYSDQWNLEHYDHCLNKNPWQNPYTKGEKGVWRPKSTYDYINNRNFRTYHPNGNGSLKDVDIKNSGIIDNVSLFNWQNPFFEYCNQNWVRTGNVTKYNLDGTAIEARDVLGNHQVEIYGYNDNLIVANGVNTKYYEIGYESFEEPGTTGNIQTVAAAGHYNNGNLDFLPFLNCSNSIVKRQENYRLCYPTKLSSSGNTVYILVYKPYDELSNINLSEISLNLTNGVTKIEIPATSLIQEYKVNLNLGDHFQIPGLAPTLDETTKDQFTIYEVEIPNTVNLGTNWWAGDATLIYEQDLTNTNSILPSSGKAQFSTTKAHTGKHSLQLTMGVNQRLTFPQNTLHLQLNKDYIFSAWINVGSTFGSVSKIKHTYDNGELEIRMGGTLMKPKGAIIDGWQRVEGAFNYIGNNDLTFLDNTGTRVMYIDDIRIYPANGNMESYVYDPVNYRLRATLDNNNYATFYVYDDDGSLILVKKETERGIKTIQESRSYVKRHNQ